MTTRISQKNGEQYETYQCRKSVVDGVEHREFARVNKRDVLSRHNVHSTDKKRPNVVYVVTERITTGADAHTHEERQLARFDCGCENYWFQYQKLGPLAWCKHCQQAADALLVEHQNKVRQMLERRLRQRAQMGDMGAANLLNELFTSEELAAQHD